MTDHLSLTAHVIERQAATIERLTAEGDAALAEVERLRQSLWDIFAALGFDTDGDPTPAAIVGDLGAQVLAAAREHRRDSEDGYDEVAAENAALRAQVAELEAAFLNTDARLDAERAKVAAVLVLCDRPWRDREGIQVVSAEDILAALGPDTGEGTDGPA